MGERRRQVLVVARNPKLGERLVAWLEESGRDTTLATTFGDAKTRLAGRPELVVAELKLGEYNGLHLALKAEALGIPVIIVGPADAVLQKDAQSIHATYLTNLARGAVLDAVDRVLPEPVATPANPVLPFRARATTIPAEAEMMWRAFSESPSSELSAFGRTMLPN